jgi:hypothetical protein
MAEAAEVSVADLVKANDVAPVERKEPSRITVVTNENFDSYVDDQMGVVKPTPEQEAEQALAKVEEEKAAKKAAEKDDDDPTHDADLPEDKKHGINERFAKQAERRKAAEAAAEAAKESARASQERAEAAERLAAELKAKYEPPKEQDPKPTPGQFASVEDFSAALEEWTADNTRREDARKSAESAETARRESVAKDWMTRQAAFKEAHPDYETTIQQSGVKVSDQVRDAIVESEAGPEILYHLAQHTDEAEKIAGMTILGALRAIGRLEATLGGTAKPAPKSEARPVAEISRAPAPITPLRGANAPAANLSGHQEVPKDMTYDTWRSLRKAGKIK